MSKPKFKVGDEVVVTSMYSDNYNEAFSSGDLVIGNSYLIGHIEELHHVDWCKSGYKYTLEAANSWGVDETMIKLANNKVSLDNTKIDVAAYAEQYGLALEQANKEVKDFLITNGFNAHRDSYSEIKNEIYVYEDKDFTCDTCGITYFNRHPHKEIFLERNIVLTIKQEPDIIEIDGVKYDKQSVLNAIKNFEITE